VTALNRRQSGANENVPPGADRADRAHNLKLRIASAAVMAPLAVFAVYAGGWLFLSVCLIAAGAILWEWTQLVLGRADPRVLIPGFAGLVSALSLAPEGEAWGAFGMIIIAAVLAGGILAAFPKPFPAPSRPLWAAAGIVYSGLGMVGPALLRSDREWGLQALLFLFATVWITDIFAYCAGRLIGGPLLCPRLSPNKTWAGAFGGLAGGVAAGTAVAYASGVGALAWAGALALILSILAQGGDLLESAIKRRFGAKDASKLIPGHGGVMDRLDGFIVAALAAALIGILHESSVAPARGLLIW
jgi:phosphatidate cytidylyltransferase